jgi:hypothetical protein
LLVDISWFQSKTPITGESAMNKVSVFFISAAIAVTLTGCSNLMPASTINPNYTSANPELMRIGGDAPIDKEPEMVNLGSYCLRVTEKWKADGQTPDGQKIWSRDTLRKVVPCR